MKLKIDNSLLVEDFFGCATLLGVVAPMKDYQFIWNINQYLGYKFRVNHSLEIQLRKKDRNYFFSIFEYCAPTSNTIHYLYNNHCDGEYLLPEFKHLDYLWLIKDDEIHENDISIMIPSLRTIPGVQLVTEMTHEKIKNKEHLIL